MESKAGGEGGIRTLDTGFSPYNGLANFVRTAPVARNQLLSFSIGLAVRAGFCHLYANMHHFMHHCGQTKKPPSTWDVRQNLASAKLRSPFLKLLKPSLGQIVDCWRRHASSCTPASVAGRLGTLRSTVAQLTPVTAQLTAVAA
jgi:hypothetical protein